MNEKSSKCSSAIFCELIRSNDSFDVMEKETQFTNCIEMNSYTFAEFLALLQWHSLKQSWIITAFLGSISISSWGFFSFGLPVCNIPEHFKFETRTVYSSGQIYGIRGCFCNLYSHYINLKHVGFFLKNLVREDSTWAVKEL